MLPFIAKLAELGIEPLSGSTFQPLSERDIERLQNKEEGSLPEPYKQFLATYGAATFSVFVNCTPHSDPLLFGWFYGLDELVGAVDDFEDVLPEGIMPIGDDGGGNQFCLGVRGKDFEKVYFHNHSIGWQADADAYRGRGEEVPEAIRHQTVSEIAPSFEQFILGMVNEP